MAECRGALALYWEIPAVTLVRKSAALRDVSFHLPYLFLENGGGVISNWVSAPSIHIISCPLFIIYSAFQI